jgi:hypothetical protein
LNIFLFYGGAGKIVNSSAGNESKNKKALTIGQNLFSLLPSPALPGSGSVGMFSVKLNLTPPESKNW